ncbi:hypothetical protein ABGB17_05080 [Sphaerisporangium sp. B11E5]|uniref:hypothetical protein n=1 Tax=Sphaerisporangium sp. B11E5 TaxID=3153563 RepID=UPI00325D45D8
MEAVRSIWTAPRVMGIAGALIFLTYLTLPVLTDVRAREGRMARSVLDGKAEKRFLLRLLGMSTDNAWSGGIRNPLVVDAACALSSRHLAFAGMRPGHIQFMGGLIAIAPLMAAPGDRRTEECARYWRYVTAAMALLHCRLADESTVTAFCTAYVSAYAGPTPEGGQMIRALAARHPAYVTAALPLLFPTSRTVAQTALRNTRCSQH